MKEKFLRSRKSFKKGKVLITKTTHIEGELAEKASWSALKELYQISDGPVEKTAVSILNAILTHGRKYFSLTRDSVAEIARNDLNHSPPLGFSNETYKEVRAFAQDSKYFQPFQMGDRKKMKADTFELIDEELSKYVGFEDIEKQLQQAIQFSTGINESTENKCTVSSPTEKTPEEIKRVSFARSPKPTATEASWTKKIGEADNEK